MAYTDTDIIRMAGDTWPTKDILKIGGVPINLTDWNVELRYKDELAVIHVIDCIISDPKGGSILIYPHARLVGDEPLEFKDYISAEMISDTTNTFTSDDVNQVWDEDEANNKYSFFIVRWKGFGFYREEYTHTVGKIELTSRWGNTNE